jgi:serine O-acetyltransferase
MPEAADLPPDPLASLHAGWSAAHPPSESRLVTTVEALRRLVFAELREEGVDGSGLAAQVREGFRGLVERAHRARNVPQPEGVVEHFLERAPAIAAMLREDVRAAFEGDPAATCELEIVACYPGVRALFVHRFAHELDALGVPLLPRMMAEFAHRETGIDLHPSARIGRGVFLDHGTGIVVGQTAVIGDGCRLYQGVTLGARSFDREPDGSMRRGYKRHPTLEDQVVVYAGATILGGDTVIGRGSVIAGGVFLTKSVPAGHVVTGPRLELRMISMGGTI